MTKDKLAALVAAQSDDEEDFDIYSSIYFQDQNEIFMDDFFNEVAAIRGMIDKIRRQMEQVKEKQSIILSTPHTDEKTKHQLESLTNEIDQTAHQVRAKLKQLQLRPEDDTASITDETSAHFRIRTTQILTLSTTVVDIMTEYNNLQVDYREKCKARLRRQLGIAGKQTTNEQLERMLEEGSSAIFTQDIIMTTPQAIQSVVEIKARHADIIKLEKSLKELHDMFVDMALLIENQGELVNRIEYHVGLARDHVEAAYVDIHHAQTIHYNDKKRKLLIIISLLVIVIVLILIISVFLCS